MHSVDVTSGEEIKSGQEMKGLTTFMTASIKLGEIHVTLLKLTGGIYENGPFRRVNWHINIDLLCPHCPLHYSTLLDRIRT